jgi:SAM-dependent methyltransferase
MTDINAPSSMTRCTVCQGTDVRPSFEIGSYALSHCNQCGHTWVSAGVDGDVLAKAYGEEYYAAGDEGHAVGYRDYLRDAKLRSKGFKERLDLIERHVPKRGRILDYGCAVGLFVKVAADAGWDSMGYERSEWAANYGRRELGVNIVVGDGTRGLPFEGGFDVVTMWDVVEHLDDPRAVVGAVARVLKPGGLLALNTVNGSSVGARLAGRDWRHLAPPHHLQYFTRASLTRLLNELDLQLVSTRALGVLLGAKRAEAPLRGVASWVEYAATHWRTAPMAGRLNLLDEIEVFAAKR